MLGEGSQPKGGLRPASARDTDLDSLRAAVTIAEAALKAAEARFEKAKADMQQRFEVELQAARRRERQIAAARAQRLCARNKHVVH